jgi:hypothetical protein
MGFLTNLVSATVKTALTPIAVIKDAVDVVRGEEPETTKSLLNSAFEDVADATESLGDGELL